MDRMWINSILWEVDKCYIPNILLLRKLCRWVAGVMHTQSQIHTPRVAKGVGTNAWKMCTETFIWACGIVTFLPGIPASVCQWRLQLEGYYGMHRVDRGQNHKFGMSHGQTGKIYDWSGSTSATWCCGFRMPGMGVRSDSGFSLYTPSSNCKQCDWLKMAVLLASGTRNMFFNCLDFTASWLNRHTHTCQCMQGDTCVKLIHIHIWSKRQKCEP